MLTTIEDDSIFYGNSWECQQSESPVFLFQHDGQPDQVHGAAQPLSAKLGKIKENSDPGPSQKQELKTRQTLTKLHGQSSN